MSVPQYGQNYSNWWQQQPWASALPPQPTPMAPTGSYAAAGATPPLPTGWGTPQWGTQPVAGPSASFFQRADGGPGPGAGAGASAPWGLATHYTAANDRASGYNGENGWGRAQRWLGDLYAQATPQEQSDPHFKALAERYAGGGIKWAEEHGFGPAGFDYTGIVSNIYNPGQALAAIRAGQDPAHAQADARGLSTVAPAGAAPTTPNAGGQPMATYPPVGPTPVDIPGGPPGGGGGTPGGGGDIQGNFYLNNPDALEALIAQRFGIKPGVHSLYGDYLMQHVAPIVTSLLNLGGLGNSANAADSLSSRLNNFVGMAQGPGFAGNVQAQGRQLLNDPSVQAAIGNMPGAQQPALFNQLAGLSTVGAAPLYAAAQKQRLLDAASQWALGQGKLGADPNFSYMKYWQEQPAWAQFAGAGG